MAHPRPRFLLPALLGLALAACALARPGGPDPEALLRSMSLEDKVGQCFLVLFEGAELSPLGRELIAGRRAGGIVLFSRTGNTKDPAQVAGLTAQAQALAAQSGHALGLFVAVDQEGGQAARLRQGFTVLPPAMALGAARDPAATRRAAALVAAEMAAVGVNLALAPVLDLALDPANPVIGPRSFGADPAAVAAQGLAFAAGCMEAGVLPAAKHFPGHGDSAVDSHQALPVLPHARERLERMELAPFRAAIAAGIPAIMAAHLAAPALDPAGLPATISPALLGFLRRDMGFDGLIITDSLGMGALSRTLSPEAAALAAFMAGADLLLFGADPGFDLTSQARAMAGLAQAVRDGRVSRERLDASARRVLAAKLRLGLVPGRVPDPDRTRALDRPETRAAALDLAEKGLTLVDDPAGLIPLPPGPALVLWPGGDPALAGRFSAADPRFRVLVLPRGVDAEEMEQALAAARQAASVVLLLERADRRTAQAALARRLPRERLVLASLAEPYDLALFPDAGARLAVYGKVPACIEALARVLAGQARPGGRLPVPVPGLDPAP